MRRSPHFGIRFSLLYTVFPAVTLAGTFSLGGNAYSAGGSAVDQINRSASHEEDQVDLIEWNHFIDDDGREVFQQVVFYDWSNIEKRFHARAWRLVKTESQVPRRFWKPDRYECSWHDDQGRKRVIADRMRETWTQQDPERTNRKFLPEDQRVPLFASNQVDPIDR